MIQVIGFTKTRLNLREGPGSEFAVSQVLSKGARLEVLEDMGSWLNVLCEGSYGFVNETYVSLQEIALEAPPPDLLDHDHGLHAKTLTSVNLHEGPGEEYAVVSTLLPETEIRIFEDHGDWLNVMVGGVLGYVHEKSVGIQDEDASSALNDAAEPDFDSEIATLANVHTPTSLKAGPGEEFLTMQALQPGDELVVIEDLGEWLSVFYNGQPGCVHETAVTLAWRIIGYTTASQKLYSGPGKSYSILTIVPENVALEILEDHGEWLDVRYRGMHGYVNELFVQYADPGLVPADEGDADSHADLQPAEPHKTWLVQLARNAADHYGAALSVLASQAGIDYEVAAAVAAVEFKQHGFGPGGKMVIRFENHVFWQYWGKQNQERFDAHFRFSVDEPWQGHAFRTDANAGTWQDVHGRSQVGEWAAYHFAAEQNITAARLSLSMGASQIMGFNFSLLAYKSVHEMFDAFQSSEDVQLRGFFDLVHGGVVPNDGIGALRQKDFPAFARYYHGTEKAEKYAALLQQAYEYLLMGE